MDRKTVQTRRQIPGQRDGLPVFSGKLRFVFKDRSDDIAGIFFDQ